MTKRKQTTQAGAVELEESALDKAQGGTVGVTTTIVQKVVGGTYKIADGSVRPTAISQADGSV